ncbi:MAG: VOC family protein [Acidimicrobiales bacterium]|nr:VOC family protein [Acidimicrobiales bacterium]
MKPMVRGLSHDSVTVSDIDRSLHFYRDFLGLEIAAEEEDTFDLTTPEGVPYTMHRRGVYLRWAEEDPAESFLVLNCHLNRPPLGTPAVIGQLGIDHLGLWVHDVDALVDRAAQLGDITIAGPTRVHAAIKYGFVSTPGAVKSAMFRDPDGTFVQTDQWLPEPGPEPSPASGVPH